MQCGRKTLCWKHIVLPVHGYPDTDGLLLSSTGDREEGVTKGMNKGKTELRVNCKT